MAERGFVTFEMTPRFIVRCIVFLLISPMIYKETGIVTTLFIGILTTETALKADWMQAIHELQMTTTEKIKDILEFQNEFVAMRIKQIKENNAKVKGLRKRK